MKVWPPCEYCQCYVFCSIEGNCKVEHLRKYLAPLETWFWLCCLWHNTLSQGSFETGSSGPNQWGADGAMLFVALEVLCGFLGSTLAPFVLHRENHVFCGFSVC